MSNYLSITQAQLSSTLSNPDPSGWIIKYNHSNNSIEFIVNGQSSPCHIENNAGTFMSYFLNIHNDPDYPDPTDYVDFFFLNFSEYKYVVDAMSNLSSWRIHSGETTFSFTNALGNLISKSFKTLQFQPLSAGVITPNNSLYPNLITAAPCPPCWHTGLEKIIKKEHPYTGGIS